MDLALSRTVTLESPTAAESERALVERARSSSADGEAFAELYRRHHGAIAGYLARRLGSADRGELVRDLVAETFLLALEQLPRYRERGAPFRAWLYRLATTRLHRWLRRRDRRPEALTEEPADASVAHDPEARRPVELAREALLALPARYQSALALFHLEGLSVAEVAQVLGCREGTVKARLHRGRERLRRRLAPHAEELFA